ncbi:MAG: hypothetical protein AW12_00071 [Candidatus Accumulibacter sp. BA-94]|nr:MAG: hypothetical protein AW12_00071 [Candidatus Accumulibacter sp. BA-94]
MLRQRLGGTDVLDADELEADDSEGGGEFAGSVLAGQYARQRRNARDSAATVSPAIDGCVW